MNRIDNDIIADILATANRAHQYWKDGETPFTDEQYLRSLPQYDPEATARAGHTDGTVVLTDGTVVWFEHIDTMRWNATRPKGGTDE